MGVTITISEVIDSIAIPRVARGMLPVARCGGGFERVSGLTSSASFSITVLGFAANRPHT